MQTRNEVKRNIHEPIKDGRAWIEINLTALEHNIEQLRVSMPDGCEIMAIVKANAYGLGGPQISRALQGYGVRAFATATIGEGISLRRGGIKGSILILGPTDLRDVQLLTRFKLTQLITDAEYANILNNARVGRIRAHIAVDTGMHRLGIEAEDIEQITRVFTYENLKITGIGTHLATADSLHPDSANYAKLQIKRFFTAVQELKRRGYNPGKTHVQASAGMLNYPELDCGYARAGIAMYGIMAIDSHTYTRPEFHPVVSLKARIAQIRNIKAGEPVSYGRTYTAQSDMKIATVSIGYADGVPRQMSGAGGFCLVRGKKAPIIGRICMDLIMLDVSNIDSAVYGDVVTIIGKDGGEEIRCEEFAFRSDTITNDILSRLGARLPRIFIK